MPERRLTLLKVNRQEDAPQSLFERNFRHDIQAALNPEYSVTRYNRVWRLSAPQVVDGRWLWAKLGFQTSPDESVEYDEALHDFVSVPGSRGRGNYSLFVLDLETQFLLFEERPPDIKRNSFRGALNGILRLTDMEFRFTADFVGDEERFERWLAQVDAVTRFYVALRRPNPDWDPRFEEVEKVMESSHAARLTVEARPPEEESLQIKDTPLEAFAEYAGQGYGHVRASGKSGNKKRFFDSERNLRGATVEVAKDEEPRSVVQRIISTMLDIILS